MWPAAVQSHMTAGLPMKHDWAFHARVKAYGTNALTNKGVWTGDYDLNLTLGGLARVYEGAMGGLELGEIRYRTGTLIMSQDINLALSPEGLEIVKGFNSRMAPCDLYCLCWDARTMTYLGERRFIKGFIDSAAIHTAEQGGTDSLSIKLVSVARKGTMTTTGKQSDVSQKQRGANDDFRIYSDLGTVAADPWGGENDDD